MASVRQIQHVIADKMELPDPIGRRQLEGFYGVDLVVDETQSANVAHVGEHSGSDRTQVALLDRQ